MSCCEMLSLWIIFQLLVLGPTIGRVRYDHENGITRDSSEYPPLWFVTLACFIFPLVHLLLPPMMDKGRTK